MRARSRSLLVPVAAGLLGALALAKLGLLTMAFTDYENESEPALLGLAVANKPWAVLAVVPVLLMLPAARVRALAMAGAVAAVVLAPMLLAGGSGLTTTVAVAHGSGEIFNPRQIWWFLGHHTPGPVDPRELHAGYRVAPPWIGRVSHPAALLAGLLLAAAAWWRRRELDAADGFRLLALVLLSRCLLDTWNTDYYLLPTCLALVAWEVHARRAPVVALAITVVSWAAFELGPGRISPDLSAAIFLAWSLPLAFALGLGVLHPGAARRLGARAAAGVERRLPTLAAAARSAS
jgi:hypothetical protein